MTTHTFLLEVTVPDPHARGRVLAKMKLELILKTLHGATWRYLDRKEGAA